MDLEMMMFYRIAHSCDNDALKITFQIYNATHRAYRVHAKTHRFHSHNGLNIINDKFQRYCLFSSSLFAFINCCMGPIWRVCSKFETKQSVIFMCVMHVK